MLLKKPINENNKENKKRRQVLNYLAFIKFWAMILIIRSHFDESKIKKIYYGRRMCEFLFVSSGFLVGYNYYKKAMPATFYNSWKYAYKHLKTFYPLHIINSFYSIFTYKGKFNLTYYEKLIFNCLLVKVYVMGFNNISWFISVLLLCYFLSPLFLGGIGNINNSLIIFSLVVFIRAGIELLIKNGAENILSINFHFNHVIKLMEFYLGMLMIPLFLKIKCFLDKYENKIYLKYLFTNIQIIFPVFIYFIMLEFNYKLSRCYFVLIFGLCIFSISFDYGYLSIIIKKKIFQEIMSCQMEMYLLHLNLNSILMKILISHWPQNSEFKFLMQIIFIFIISYIYKKIFKERLANLLDKIINIFFTIFIIN